MLFRARATLETDLQIEREWRLGLQAEVKTEKGKVEVLTDELKDVNRAYKVNFKLELLQSKVVKNILSFISFSPA